MWVSRHPLNNSLAVFVHGIFGSRWVTWKSHVDFFQRIYKQRPALSSYDIYFFHYQTGILDQPPLFPDVTNQLKTFLDQEGERYDTIALVCHSQGGILGKRYILEELRKGRGRALKVDLVVTLNTPHRGARLWLYPVLGFAFVANILSRMCKGHLLRQLAELTAHSRNIKFLKQNWGEPYISPDPEPPTASRRHIRSIALGSRRDLFVSRKSAEGFFVDTPNYRIGGHPVDSEAVAEYGGQCLAEHQDPMGVTRELDRIYGDPASLVAHKSRCQPVASRLLDELGIASPSSPDYRSCKTTSLIDDFPDAFRRHPLRNLDLLGAFERFVGKILTD